MLTHFFSGATFPSGPGWFFLLQPRADAHSLTAGLGGDASRRGVCFFFWRGPARTGVAFFFAVAPPGRSLTHCGLWRPQQGPGGVFSVFFCGPAEPGEPTTKNVWCTTSGLKRPGGATAEKKKTLPTRKPEPTHTVQILHTGVSENRGSKYGTLHLMIRTPK